MSRTKATMWRSCFGGLCKSEPEKLIGKVKSNSDVHSQAVQTRFFFQTTRVNLKAFDCRHKTKFIFYNPLEIKFRIHRGQGKLITWQLYFSYTETALTNSFQTAGEGMKIQMPHSILLLVKLQPGLFSGFGLLSYTNLEPGGNETTWLSSSGTVLPHRLPAGILPGRDTVITAFSHWSGNWWSQKERLINIKQS